MTGALAAGCACAGALHSPDCERVRAQRDAFLEGERKAWRSFDLALSQKRRDYAGALFVAVRKYEEQHFQRGGSAARILAGSSGKGRAFRTPEEAGMDAYANVVAGARTGYLEALVHASADYHTRVAPLRASLENARIRPGADGSPGKETPEAAWLPHGAGRKAPPHAAAPSWTMPAVAFALFVASASLAFQSFTEPLFLLLSAVVAATALLGLCAWRGTALFWKLAVLVLAAGALTFGASTGQWSATLPPLLMAAVVLRALAGRARKTFFKKRAAEGAAL